ncbi:MAG: hypothetical protein JNJ60_03420 [Rhodocyclaceae bacterium]|nr:hypothetical protein [Rhodocyclaceae bacterium]
MGADYWQGFAPSRRRLTAFSRREILLYSELSRAFVRIRHCIGALPKEVLDMDFIERIFGISPDGGSGTFELLLFLVPLMGILLLRMRARRRSRKP